MTNQHGKTQVLTKIHPWNRQKDDCSRGSSGLMCGPACPDVISPIVCLVFKALVSVIPDYDKYLQQGSCGAAPNL